MTSPDIMSSLSDLDLAVPTRLTNQLSEAVDGDFEIIGLIARGAMGIVFLARDLKLDREVAIKVLLADAFTTKSEVERFKLEARTVARLTHPNIVPVFSVLEHEELLLYIMQFVQGETLEQMIARGPMDPDVVEAIVVMMAEGLAYAHEQNIVHRDVKPANVIVDERGRAIIMDFGIAQLPENHGLTVAGSLVGTPNYASPEQCRAESAQPASDQYSLGVVAYEMLTGERLFESDSIAGIIQHHLRTPPPDIQEKRPDCPAALAHAISRMLEKTPEARWPDLTALVDYLGGPRHTAPIAALSGSQESADGASGGYHAPAHDGTNPPATHGPSGTPAATPNRAPKAPLSALVMIATAAILIALTSTGLLSNLGFGPDTPPAPQEIAEGPATSGTTPDGAAAATDTTDGAPSDEGREGGMLGADPDPEEREPAGDGTRRVAVGDPGDTDPATPPASTAREAAGGSSTATNTLPPEAVASTPVEQAPPPRTTPATTPATTPESTVVDDTPATLLLGTRGLAAVLFLDDVPMGAASRLRTWTIDPGNRQLSLRVEGCPSWDTTIVAPAGGEVRLGYRLPDCGREETFR